MILNRRLICLCLVLPVLVLPVLAASATAKQSYHENRQDQLIHALQRNATSTSSAIATVSHGLSSVTGKVATITQSIGTLGKKLAILNSSITSLSTSVTKVQAQLVPEYGFARAEVAQSGGQPSGLPAIYTPQIPRDGIDPGQTSGEVVVLCNTAPCKLTLLATVRSPRPAPTGAKAPGQIGGGVLVHSASGATNGQLVAVGNVLGDGKHPGKTVDLTNVGQVGMAPAPDSALTPVVFDSAAGHGINVASDGSLTIPSAGLYSVTGTFLFYDLDNLLAPARDVSRASHSGRSS